MKKSSREVREQTRPVSESSGLPYIATEPVLIARASKKTALQGSKVLRAGCPCVFECGLTCHPALAGLVTQWFYGINSFDSLERLEQLQSSVGVWKAKTHHQSNCLFEVLFRGVFPKKVKVRQFVVKKHIYCQAILDYYTLDCQAGPACRLRLCRGSRTPHLPIEQNMCTPLPEFPQQGVNRLLGLLPARLRPPVQALASYASTAFLSLRQALQSVEALQAENQALREEVAELKARAHESPPIAITAPVWYLADLGAGGAGLRQRRAFSVVATEGEVEAPVYPETCSPCAQHLESNRCGSGRDGAPAHH